MLPEVFLMAHGMNIGGMINNTETEPVKKKIKAIWE
jgi:hypothetical protein